MLPSMSSHCLLISLAVVVARTAALGIPINPDALLAGGISRNNLTIPSNSVPHCTSDAGWYGPSSPDTGFFSDCGETYSALWTEYKKYNIFAQFEFLPVGAAQAQPQREPMRTPRRYTYGSCTTAIVNLKDVPAHYVPDAQGPFVGSAVTGFENIINKHQELGKCHAWPKKEIGWIAIGHRYLETFRGAFIRANHQCDWGLTREIAKEE